MTSTTHTPNRKPRKKHVADGKTAGDTMLTPPDLLKSLGPFGLDPCTPPRSLGPMPWRTARTMLTPEEDGLETPWPRARRVWCNPPYSDPLAWVRKAVLHGNTLMLLPATSCETRWCQLAFNEAEVVFFFAGRLLFCYHPTGEKATGKWFPNMLAAFGREEGHRLEAWARKNKGKWPGTLMRKTR